MRRTSANASSTCARGRWRNSTSRNTDRELVAIVVASTPAAAAVGEALRRRGYRCVRREPATLAPLPAAADAVVAIVDDSVGTTMAVRRLTAAPLVVVGGNPGVAAACLDAGADAWLPRDSSPEVVGAQLAAARRRAEVVQPATEALRAGSLLVDGPARRVTAGGVVLELSPREFELLKALVAHQGRALTRDRILALAWGPRFVGEPKTVDVHVAWLRQKLDGTGVRITSLRGIGYRLDVLIEDGQRLTQGLPTAAALLTT